MATFNTATFYVVALGAAPYWEREGYWSSLHYPETNTDELQYGGAGNLRVVLDCWTSADSQMNLLEAKAHPTTPTGWASTSVSNLYGDGTTFDNVILRAITDKRRTWTGTWYFRAEFEQVTT
jgi:hypothetical protein